MSEFTVAVTGASGSRCAARLLCALTAHPEVKRVNAVVSSSALLVARTELAASGADNDAAGIRWVREALLSPDGDPAKVTWFDEANVGASIASGSHLSAGMAIVPCSTGTLGAIASGATRNLIHRAAEVTLKERRRLILGVREAPLSLIHIENMATVTRAGAIVVPITPAFYSLPRTIDDVIELYVARVVDLLGLSHGLGKRWSG